MPREGRLLESSLNLLKDKHKAPARSEVAPIYAPRLNAPECAWLHDQRDRTSLLARTPFQSAIVHDALAGLGFQSQRTASPGQERSLTRGQGAELAGPLPQAASRQQVTHKSAGARPMVRLRGRPAVLVSSLARFLNEAAPEKNTNGQGSRAKLANTRLGVR